MATRAPSAKVSPRHVAALNAIELEFSGSRGSNKRVTDAWRIYLDHLNDRSGDPNNQDAVHRWVDEGNDLLVDLLYEMSNAAARPDGSYESERTSRSADGPGPIDSRDTHRSRRRAGHVGPKERSYFGPNSLNLLLFASVPEMPVAKDGVAR
jgi:hypothetical protein